MTMSDKYLLEGMGEARVENFTTPRLKGLLGSVNDEHQYNGSTVCQGSDVVKIILRPALQHTMRQFLKVCTTESEVILPEVWSLCSDGGNFSCDSINRYTKSCKEARSGNVYPISTPAPCTMGHMLEDDQSAILILVSLVFIGILLGVTATVAVCLICPNVHRWANSKIRGEKNSQEKIVRASTVSSEYYAAIDENTHANPIRLRPVAKPPSPYSYAQEPNGTSPTSSPAGNQNFSDPVYQSNGMSGEPIYTDTSAGMSEGYEHLNRQNPQAQSHKYAHIKSPPPNTCSAESDCSEEGHNYFVLEKKT